MWYVSHGIVPGLFTAIMAMMTGTIGEMERTKDVRSIWCNEWNRHCNIDKGDIWTITHMTRVEDLRSIFRAVE